MKERIVTPEPVKDESTPIKRKDSVNIHYEPPKAKFTPLRMEERLLGCDPAKNQPNNCPKWSLNYGSFKGQS